MAPSVITDVTRSKGKLIKVEEERKGGNEISADVYGLEMEILAHLPAKTVQSFETVCKDWLQLIRSSYFVRLHLSRDNRRRIRVLVTNSYNPRILEYNNYYQRTRQGFAFPSQFSGSGCRRVLGSADGLVMMAGKVSNEYAPGVFNPSTGKCSVLKLLQSPPCFPCCNSSCFGKVADGEYVLLMICSVQDQEIWAYKFTRSSNILNKICSTKLVSLAYFRTLYDYGTLVQGVAYWPVEIRYPIDKFDPRYQILAYHLSKNKHWVISPPAQCYFGLGSSVDGCNLIATFKRNLCSVVEVWIMKEDGWIKHANIGGSNSFSMTTIPLVFSPDGDLIMEVGKSRLMRYSFNHEEVTPLMEYGYKGDRAIMCVDTLMSPSC